MKNRACVDCAFFQISADEDDARHVGECRRYAPRAVVGAGDSSDAWFPIVYRHEWCGEFEARQ